MIAFSVFQAGVRLDAWPEPDVHPAPQEAPEVAELKDELRKSAPEVADMLELLAALRPVHELTGQIAGPPPLPLVIQQG